MSELKTKVNEASVEAFLNQVENKKRRDDAFKILEIMEKITQHPPKMWGSSIVGFDQYHYKSERSRQEGGWPMIGFSPRKTSLTIYIMPGFETYPDLAQTLAKYKAGKS